MLAATTAHLDVGFLTFLIGVGIPILTGLITKLNASSGLKAVVTLTLAVVTGAIQFALDANGVVDTKTWLTTALVTWVISIASYYGLLKPIGATDIVQTKTSTFGLGKAA